MKNKNNSLGRKDDSKKLRVDLFPFGVLAATSQILTDGAARYGERNWEKGLSYSRVFGALLRHLILWWFRINPDHDSGRDHIHHAGCEMDFLQHFVLMGTGEDNRPELSEDAKKRIEELFNENQERPSL